MITFFISLLYRHHCTINCSKTDIDEIMRYFRMYKTRVYHEYYEDHLYIFHIEPNSQLLVPVKYMFISKLEAVAFKLRFLK